MSFLGKLFRKKDLVSPPTMIKVGEIIAPEKTQKALELIEEYINMEHPMSTIEQMLVIERTRPMYKVVSNNVVRSSSSGVDIKIVSVASCLPDKNINIGDRSQLAKMAFEAIHHYASISKVQAFFLLPYHLRAKTWVEGSAIPPEEQCRIYSGVENLLLEIYEELPQGGTITDELVGQKVDRLIQSIETEGRPRATQQKGQPAVTLQAEETKDSHREASSGDSPLPVGLEHQDVQAGNRSLVQQCKSCEQEVLPVTINDKQYCPNCGISWVESQETAVLSESEGQEIQSPFCPHCEKVVSPSVIAGDSYCPDCGSRL